MHLSSVHFDYEHNSEGKDGSNRNIARSLIFVKIPYPII